MFYRCRSLREFVGEMLVNSMNCSIRTGVITESFPAYIFSRSEIYKLYAMRDRSVWKWAFLFSYEKYATELMFEISWRYKLTIRFGSLAGKHEYRI